MNNRAKSYQNLARQTLKNKAFVFFLVPGSCQASWSRKTWNALKFWPDTQESEGLHMGVKWRMCVKVARGVCQSCFDCQYGLRSSRWSEDFLTVAADSIARAFFMFGSIRKGLTSCSSSKGQVLWNFGAGF